MTIRALSRLAVPVLACGLVALRPAGDVSCRPNIFGGEDCVDAPGGRVSSSRPNIFGGFDTTLPDGSRASSRPNIFGGKDVGTPRGTIRSRPNIFGGATTSSRTGVAPSRGRISSVGRICEGRVG